MWNLEAVLINPYDSEGFAEAIKAALEMPAEERSQRMQKMRETVAQNNIYRWAGKVVSTLTQLI